MKKKKNEFQLLFELFLRKRIEAIHEEVNH